MKKITLSLLIVSVLCCVAVSAQEPPPPPPPPPAPKYPLSAWKPFIASAHGFSVSFPAKPLEADEKTSTLLGDAFVHTWMVVTMDGRYEVAAIQLPFETNGAEKIQRQFGRMREELLEKYRGTLQSEKELDLKGVPGREFRMSVYQGKGTLQARVFSRRDRLWLLISDTINREPLLKEPALFHDSFQLTETASPGEPEAEAFQGGVPGHIVEIAPSPKAVPSPAKRSSVRKPGDNVFDSKDAPPPPVAGTPVTDEGAPPAPAGGIPGGTVFELPEQKWQEFISEAGLFTATFPAKPREQESDAASEFGQIRFRVAQSLSLSPLFACTIIYSDYPDEAAAKKIFDQRKESLSSKGKILSDTEITVDGVTGSEIRLEASAGKLMVNRIFPAGKRVYQVMTISLPGQEDAPELKKFRESFHLKTQN